jgi:multiple sugar transport system ATP-binding protein
MASVAFEGVRKVYPGGVEVVKGIDLAIADGEFVTLVGPSGCGKSTTLNLIAGFEHPTAGTVRIGGNVVNDLSPKERGVAMVFQSYALYPHMNVWRNIAFPLEVAGVDKKSIDQRVRETAERLGVDGLLERKPKELSGGQRQRVALGRALVRRPKLCLFDEPLSNLDAALRAQMRAELKKLHEDLTATFIYVTHDQAEAMTLSDRIVVLNQGHIAQAAPPREIYDRPATTFVASFIGSPRINLVAPATVGWGEIGSDTLLGIRPEDALVSADEAPGSLGGDVYVVEPMGPETWVTLDLAGERIIGKAPAAYRARSGQRAFVRIDRERVLHFDRASGMRRERE